MLPFSDRKSPTVAASRRRSLVRDACGCLQQQMFFWGCDARHRSGNLLSGFGLMRIARTKNASEGSSRYRMDWGDGTVELHSFCAGWYPRSGDGVVFIRNREHLYSCTGDEPLTPGAYEDERHRGTDADTMLQTCRPLLEWVAEYEQWIETRTPGDYRRNCWMKLLSRMGGRPWLPPAEAKTWRQCFLADPATTPRARELLRRRPAHSRPAYPSPRKILANTR